MLEALGTFSELLTLRVTSRGQGARPARLVSAIRRAPGVRLAALPAPGGAVPVRSGACEDLSILSQEGTVSAGQPGARGLCSLLCAPLHRGTCLFELCVLGVCAFKGLMF